MNCQYWNQTCGYELPSDVKQVPEDQDQYKDMMAIVQARGYPIESHLVTTLDGYELTMFRIPYGKTGDLTIGGKPPVLLQHGLLDSSYTWVNNFETESLGYILADHGFDVWFGNNRGNTYGRSHVMLDPDDGTEEFWKFSWDEMAYYDLPAFINHIATETGYNSLGYIGHSEGTIQMFAAASSTAESEVLRDAISKVNIFVALAPVAYVSNLHSEILVKLAHSDVVQVLQLQLHEFDEVLVNIYFLLQKLEARGVYEFLPNGKVEEFAPQICQMAEHACDFFIGALCGPTNNINISRYQVIIMYFICVLL